MKNKLPEGSVKIHSNDWGILYKKGVGKKAIVTLEVDLFIDNRASTYFIRVPSHIKDAGEAFQWAFPQQLAGFRNES